MENCHCKFHWCCEIICQNCTRELDIHTCKAEVEAFDDTTPNTSNVLMTTSDKKLVKSKKRRCKKRRKKGKKCSRKPKAKRRSKRHLSQKTDFYKVHIQNSNIVDANEKQKPNQKIFNFTPNKQPIKSKNSFGKMLWSWWQKFHHFVFGKT